MKPVENMEKFFDELKQIGGEMGKAQSKLFSEIVSDLDRTHAHIKTQLDTLDSQFLQFKKIAFQMAVND